MELVAAKLRALIVSGELTPGRRLRQIDVARRFGVSTTPVREAFAALAREGLVEVDAYRGAVVFSPSLTDIRENYEMRIALERLATELAATAISDGDCVVLAGLLDEMASSLENRVLHNELNRRFHLLIYQAAQRPGLVRLIAQLRDAAAAYLLLAPKDESTRDVSAEHAEILGALRAHEPERAGAAMDSHLKSSFENIMRAIAQLPAARVPGRRPRLRDSRT
jgi:DNA-binding GntR family transcriptional regulator